MSEKHAFERSSDNDGPGGAPLCRICGRAFMAEVHRPEPVVLVDEDNFRLACKIVKDWRENSDGRDAELIDRITAVLTEATR